MSGRGPVSADTVSEGGSESKEPSSFSSSSDRKDSSGTGFETSEISKSRSEAPRPGASSSRSRGSALTQTPYCSNSPLGAPGVVVALFGPESGRMAMVTPLRQSLIQYRHSGLAY